MILYGRDDSRFKVGTTELIDSTEQLRKDQAQIWTEIKAQSRRLSLAGTEYRGDPERCQIRDASSLCWSTFPDVLAATLTAGISFGSGATVAGVPATVLQLPIEEDLIQAIVPSLDMNVAAALLIGQTHWVVIYGLSDDGPGHFYGYDPGYGKISGTLQHLRNMIDAQTTGFYKRRCVAVTAASAADRTVAPLMRRPHSQPPQEPGPPVGPRPLPPGLDTRLASDLAKDLEWRPTFEGAELRFVLRVRGPAGRFYYLLDYAAPAVSRSDIALAPRVGSIIVDGYDLHPIMTAGVERRGQALPRLVGPHEVLSVLDAFDGQVKWIDGVPTTLCRSGFLVGEEELMWQPCDQSTSPFMPFYVVYHPGPGGDPRILYLRADGQLFPDLTRTTAGI